MLIGETADELGGSHYLRLLAQAAAGSVPSIDLQSAPRIMGVMHQAIVRQLVRSCHDLSEGGLGVALAEMCFAGAVGAVVDLTSVPSRTTLRDDVLLFSESAPRFLLEVGPDQLADLLSLFERAGIPCAMIGSTRGHSTLVLRSNGKEIACLTIDALEQSFRSGLEL
ncbi:MAG: AIR synthase-related protein [Planctomycetota bacterium]